MRIENKLKLNEIGKKSRIAMTLYGQTAAKKLEAQAKANAPWQDRTANARNSLYGNFYWQGYQAKIFLSGNMEYSVYLELAMEKRYAIIIPTIKENQNEVFANFAKVVRGIV